MIKLITSLTEPLFHIDIPGVVEGSFNFATVVFLLGGGFIMYTAVKEISHMLSVEHLESEGASAIKKQVTTVIASIVLMNLIFSFDSILSALAITDVFLVLAVAIVISGVAMLMLADHVSEFLRRNRKYEVLGLFIPLIVGVVLLGEGGHVAHLKLMGFPVEPMSKTTFYFSIAVLVVIDIMQSGYQRKLNTARQLESAQAPVARGQTPRS